MPLRYALVVLCLLPLAARAQTPGTCAPGRAERDLAVGDVRARVFNTGSLFYGNTSSAAYLVPASEQRSPIYAAGLWVGGKAGGELRVAGATYADYEFWPGPLLDGGVLPRPEDCAAYDRIWRVSRGDVARFYATGESTADLVEWPYELGAPVLDGDGDPTNYDLAAGDQPAISGEQMLWWVMNDVGNAHWNTFTPPMGLEVRVSAFAFADGPVALRTATFYRYTLLHRGPAPLDSAYLSIFVDPDLGDSADDYVGSDTLREMGFVYNADDADGNGQPPSYGTPPPAAGFDLLSDGLGSVMYFASLGAGDPTSDPSNGRDIYNLMRGLWKDGVPLTEGGTGYNSGGPVTTVVYPGDPVTRAFWSERCPNQPCGAGAPAGDRRFVLTSSSFVLAPGEARTFDVALLFGRGADHLDSVTRLRAASDVAQVAYAAGYLDARPVPGFAPPPLPRAVELRRPAPNPFTDEAVIRYALPSAARVRITLVDVLGRELAVLADGAHGAGPHEAAVDGAVLAPGVYVARVWVNGEVVAALPLTRR
jgi:hypothetical protein